MSPRYKQSLTRIFVKPCTDRAKLGDIAIATQWKRSKKETRVNVERWDGELGL